MEYEALRREDLRQITELDHEPLRQHDANVEQVVEQDWRGMVGALRRAPKRRAAPACGTSAGTLLLAMQPWLRRREHMGRDTKRPEEKKTEWKLPEESQQRRGIGATNVYDLRAPKLAEMFRCVLLAIRRYIWTPRAWHQRQRFALNKRHVLAAAAASAADCRAASTRRASLGTQQQGGEHA